MRRTLLVTSVAGGALAALLAGTAAVASTSSTIGAATATQTCSADCTGTGIGTGNAEMRRSGNAQMRGNGSAQQRGNTSGTHTDLPASGTLTTAQRTKLADMAEEEKLSHDVYVALAAATGDRRFTRIAASEAQHLSAVRTLLARYGIADPTAGKADGQFTSTTMASLYGTLVTQGRGSLSAALAVGVRIEKMDIADLVTARSGVTAPDVLKVYASLSAGSQNHLRAFGG